MVKPERLTIEQLNDIQIMSEFNKHHNTNVRGWDIILSENSRSTKDREHQYKDYCNWYDNHFSKLGQVLR